MGDMDMPGLGVMPVEVNGEEMLMTEVTQLWRFDLLHFLHAFTTHGIGDSACRPASSLIQQHRLQLECPILSRTVSWQGAKGAPMLRC